MPPDGRGRSLAEGVLPARVDEPAVPVELDRLSPWHRPRKQFVREEQWMRFARRLIRRERGRPGLPVREELPPEVCYLTLPGIDYLDVRELADVCREMDCRLTSIGFQSGEEGNRYVARAQVREKSLIDAGHITERSHTFGRRFEDIVHRKGQAYRDLKGRGPFHIVNIDACGSIAAPAADHANRLVDALCILVELQLELMTSRWLLFVTTDAHPESIAQQTLDRLCRAIFENADANEEFRNRATPLLSQGGPDIRTAARAAGQQAGLTFLQLFSLGLAKWLLDLAQEKDWDMKTHHPYCYSTTPKHDDTPTMACLAFEFLPPFAGLRDRFGVARVEPVPEPAREDTAVRAARKVKDMADADAVIRSDEGLRVRVTKNLRQRLEEAGYERAALDQVGA